LIHARAEPKYRGVSHVTSRDATVTAAGWRKRACSVGPNADRYRNPSPADCTCDARPSVRRYHHFGSRFSPEKLSRITK
jgi:hypothetical protein